MSDGEFTVPPTLINEDNDPQASQQQRRHGYMLPGFGLIRDSESMRVNSQDSVTSNVEQHVKGNNHSDSSLSLKAPQTNVSLQENSKGQNQQRKESTPTQDTSLLMAPPLFYPTPPSNNQSPTKPRGRYFSQVLPTSNDKPKQKMKSYSIADGLFQVQSQLEQGFLSPGGPFLQPTSINGNGEISRNSIITSQNSSTSTGLNVDETTTESMHLQHGDYRKSKKHLGNKFNNFRRKSVQSMTSMESITPLYSVKMLENPVLADVAPYDGRMIGRKSTQEIKPYNHADLLARQISNINEGSKQHLEKCADVLIENQRGWFILGFPFFSSNMLFPNDPSSWTCGSTGSPASGDTSSYPLPDPSWDWTWNRWYVDMAYDVDDQGWSYSWRFGSEVWHGSHVWFHSFVRRRRWIRLRHRRHYMTQVSSGEETLPLQSISRTNSINSFRSTVPSIAEYSNYDYHKRCTADAQQYGNKYFALPPAGRIEASLSSPRLKGPTSNASFAQTQRVPGPSKPPDLLQPNIPHKIQGFIESDGATPSASSSHIFHPPKEDDDPFHVHAQMESPHSISELLIKLEAARIDRERLELFTSFVSDISNYTAVVRTNKPGSDYLYIRKILRTFIHLDSKIHLIEHLDEVNEYIKEKRAQLKKEYKKIEDTKSSENQDLDPVLLKKQRKVLKQYGDEIKKMREIITKIVQQQQYYTDKGAILSDVEDDSSDNDDDYNEEKKRKENDHQKENSGNN